MDDLRGKIEAAYPAVQVDFIQILQDLLGDLAGNPAPIEVKLFGPDMSTLKPLARQVGKILSSLPDMVDVFDGITESGPDHAKAFVAVTNPLDMLEIVFFSMLALLASQVVSGFANDRDVERRRQRAFAAPPRGSWHSLTALWRKLLRRPDQNV